MQNIPAVSSLLSPLLKSILVAREPAALKHRGRLAVMYRIEQRMRFLAVLHDLAHGLLHHVGIWSVETTNLAL